MQLLMHIRVALETKELGAPGALEHHGGGGRAGTQRGPLLALPLQLPPGAGGRKVLRGGRRVGGPRCTWVEEVPCPPR